MRVQSLGREDPLEKEMATYSDSLPWKMPWTEEPHELQSMGSQRVGHDCARTCTLSDPTAHSHSVHASTSHGMLWIREDLLWAYL